jgi:hypothetical protein
LVFANDPQTRAELASKLAEEVDEAKGLLETVDGFAEFMADPESHADFLHRFDDQDASPEKWASLLVVLGSALANEEEPLDDELRQVVMWRLAKIKTMLLFTRHIENLAWRG